MNTYLLEIGLEEIPAQMILPAVEQLKSLVQKTCESHQLSFNELNTFSTPRRLAVQIKGLPDKQEDRSVELKGPPAANKLTPKRIPNLPNSYPPWPVARVRREVSQARLVLISR